MIYGARRQMLILGLVRPMMRALCLTIALTLLAGCQYDPYAHLYTTEQPKDADVLGTYTLTEQTLTREGLAFLQGGSSTIELRGNHTFSVNNFPDWREVRPVEYAFDRLRSRSGTWRVETVGSIDDGRKPLKKHWGVRLDTSEKDLWTGGFTGKKPPYGLIFGYGDPDSGTVMQFAKTP